MQIHNTMKVVLFILAILAITTTTTTIMASSLVTVAATSSTPYNSSTASSINSTANSTANLTTATAFTALNRTPSPNTTTITPITITPNTITPITPVTPTATPLPSLWEDLFVDRARMGLIPYKEENTSLHIDYFDTPFERQYYEHDIKHMISMSARDTRDIIRPYHYHRFQQASSTFRLHCKFMLNFIQLGNGTWEKEFRLATNLIAYYRRLYTNGDHMDLVCYFVDTANQTEADCLLRLVSDPHGEPFPVVEFSSVRRRGGAFLKGEPKVSHYHPHNRVYCPLMEFILKLKSSTTEVPTVSSTTTTTTATTTTTTTTTVPTKLPEINPTTHTITTTTPTPINLTTTTAGIIQKPISNHALTMNEATENKAKVSTARINWEVIVGAPLLTFGILLLGGYLYKRKKDSHVVLDDSNIEFEVIHDHSSEGQAGTVFNGDASV